MLRWTTCCGRRVWSWTTTTSRTSPITRKAGRPARSRTRHAVRRTTRRPRRSELCTTVAAHEGDAMAVTMRDVAREAGVSPKTVSNVMNGYPYIRAETRTKVLAAIDALGYRM